MLKSKTADRICCLALVIMLALTAVVWIGKTNAGAQAQVEMGYEGLFDPSVVHTVDIEMSGWDDFIANAAAEEYAACSITIDGEKYGDVGIRAKGNTSLSSVAGMGSVKYSFKVEFDHYVKGRLYRGLDKLNLNNLIFDATMMKDYLSYTLMARMEVPSPLCSFVQVNVNGEPWGLYLAVEGVEDGFLQRNNMTTGELYKPDSMSFGGGRGNGREFDFSAFRTDGEMEVETGELPALPDAVPQAGGEDGFASSFGGSSGVSAQQGENNAAPSSGEGFGASFGQSAGGSAAPQAGNGESFQLPDMQQSTGNISFGGFNFGMGSQDVKLIYTDDDPDSYANIFDNAKTKIGKKDKARLIEALRKLNAQEDIEETVFTDEVIRYLAVHQFLCNDDSYTGMMVHNYYLYEENGRLAIIPWDYNLAFGAFNAGSDGTSTVNAPIDSPVSNSSVSDRPLVAWIFDDADAIERYHALYGEFIADTVESGWLAEEIARVSAMIRPYVEADANSFYTVAEFDQAIDILQAFCAARGASVRGQLEGSVPATTETQRLQSSLLVDGSAIDLSLMGSMNAGFGGRGTDGGFDFSALQERFAGGQNREDGETSGGFAASSGRQAAQETAIPPQGETNVPADAQAPDVQPKTKENRADAFSPLAEAERDEGSCRSWLQLGLYVLILLLAMAVIGRAPAHNR